MCEYDIFYKDIILYKLYKYKNKIFLKFDNEMNS